jgi:GH24 family phage-related lysozyme (muramidase)
MTPSSACLDLIRRFEGFRSSPYLCPAGVPTIGYGSTRYEDKAQVKLTDAPITQERANEIMLSTLQTEYAPAVKRYVRVPITQNQFDALVDFAYNAGAKNLLKSTLLRKLNERDYDAAAAQFDRWVHADGKVLTGLVRRRAAERVLFETRD